MALQAEPASSNMAAAPADFAQSFAQMFRPGAPTAPPCPQVAPMDANMAGEKQAQTSAQPAVPAAVGAPAGPLALAGVYPGAWPPAWPGTWPPPWMGVPWPANYGNHQQSWAGGQPCAFDAGAWPVGQGTPLGPPLPPTPSTGPEDAAACPVGQRVPLRSPVPPGPSARRERTPQQVAEGVEQAGTVQPIELEPLQIPGRLRVPYSYSMQADIDMVPGDHLVEPPTSFPDPPTATLPLRTHLEQMLAKTVQRCPFIRLPAEPTWSHDIKEAVVAMGYRVSRNIGHQMSNATEDEIASFCLRHLNVTMEMPVYKIFGLQRQAAGSRHLKLTEEAEDALVCRRGAEHDRAIDAQARLMVFKDTKHSAQYITRSKNHYVFSLQECGIDVCELATTRHRAIRARNRWFRANQHRKLVQEHVVHTGMYPLMQGTKPITQISPL